MGIFTPKHQRLVNQCYPTGRTTDKKPKSSETSYLLYYVNSRRSKLEKVSSYLIKKSNNDMNHRRVGNIAVTLELMNKIVKNCKENLNVFIRDFFQIMNNILTNANFNNDVGIVELLEMTFNSICTNLDGALFSGDPEFIRGYSAFVDSFFVVANEKLHNDDLLLKCCLDISLTDSLASNPKIKNYVSKSVTFSLSKFQERNPIFKRISLDRTNLYQASSPNLTKRLSKVQTRPAGLDTLNNEEGQPSDLSLIALRSFFSTTEGDKLGLSINALIEFILVTPNKELLEFICNGIPVQYRYFVILFLVRQLTQTTTTTKPSNSDPIVLLKLISAILTSDISIVGLSVLDIMRKLLAFQLEHYKENKTVEECCLTIRDLNNKTYYKEQMSDMLYEILVKLKHYKHLSGGEGKVDTTKDSIKITILTNDATELVTFAGQEAISLELFAELAPILNKCIVPLFNIVERQLSTGAAFTKVFQLLRQIKSKDIQQSMMEKIFTKFGKFALLSGLNFFLENITKPEDVYYLYHKQAADFLQIDDYKNQTEYKLQSQSLFSKDDLLNYYSDLGSNKFSKMGSQILMSRPTHVSTSDLVSDNATHSMTPDGFSIKSVSNGLLSEGAIPMNKRGTDNASKSKAQILNTKGSIYRLASDDMRSWRTARSKTPKISDLKKVVNTKAKTTDSQNKETTKTASLRGSQSVKSKVTNITFLLSELKTNDYADGETNKIQDPDEDNIVGLDKIDIARSQTTKLNSHNALPRLGSRNSTLLKSQANVVLPDIDDAFVDAAEGINVSNSRGKLFSSS
ncbi:Efr3p NDAI_0K01070 [Naumovozyma dairenensis CBS 421]|uniref:Protein EFR3 n=1 Tax=Naumovozyma dairenensis (strain ATCC 10597 / BCRC 20456 / CBS 421 / NBRC 0211 / NRRL Y-12639) TaxID=1071378 RepID=G0WHN7_NAUDC|nr:hypothetical protein NDAI_0K01070 [Naumovozyma dairenensis CBS 421]CCD27298.1 hypothetical protein NDAI_0K01070 [Naumovozyma dairenensis CBS 421]